MNVDLLGWPEREEYDMTPANLSGYPPPAPGLIGIISSGACILIIPSQNILSELTEISNGTHHVCPIRDRLDRFAFEVMDYDLAVVRASELAALPPLS